MTDKRPKKSTKKIIVFSTPTCPYCVMAKNYLKSKNVDFTEVDLTKQQDQIQKMIDKSGQTGVPQIWIGDKVIMGFDKLTINTELGIDSF